MDPQALSELYMLLDRTGMNKGQLKRFDNTCWDGLGGQPLVEVTATFHSVLHDAIDTQVRIIKILLKELQ